MVAAAPPTRRPRRGVWRRSCRNDIIGSLCVGNVMEVVRGGPGKIGINQFPLFWRRPIFLSIGNIGSMETPAAAALPKYYVLKEQILTLIEDAVPGTLIPTERALAEQYGTSRTTVRQASGELVAEGRLDRTQGRGTYVAPPKVTHVRQLTSFTDDAASQGMTASARILDISEVPADTVTAKRLAVEPGTGVHRVERIRLVNGEPLAHETAFLAGELPDLAANVEVRGSLYSALRE